MTTATIDETTIPVASTLADRLTAIRTSITNANFSSDNYDTWTTGNNSYWVVEQVWNSGLARGKVYLRFRYEVVSGTSERLHLTAFDSWNVSTHTGTNGTVEVTLDLVYNPSATYDLKISAIAHPELRGFLWQQEDRFGTLFFARPANIYRNEFNDINYAWFFLVNSNFDIAYQPLNFNPFRDAGSYAIESWASLRDKLPNATAYQLIKGVKIVSPDDCGFLGAFSSDIALVNSSGLAWKTVINEGYKEYSLVRAKSSSGIALFTKDNTLIPDTGGGDNGGGSGDGGGSASLQLAQFVEAFGYPHQGYERFGRGNITYGFSGESLITQPIIQGYRNGELTELNNIALLVSESGTFDFTVNYEFLNTNSSQASERVRGWLRLGFIVPKIYDWNVLEIYPSATAISQRISLNINLNTTGILEYSTPQDDGPPEDNVVAIMIYGEAGDVFNDVILPSGSTANYSTIIEQTWNTFDYLSVNENGELDESGSYFLIKIPGIECEVDAFARFTSSATATLNISGSFEILDIATPSNLIIPGGTPYPSTPTLWQYGEGIGYVHNGYFSNYAESRGEITYGFAGKQLITSPFRQGVGIEGPTTFENEARLITDANTFDFTVNYLLEATYLNPEISDRIRAKVKLDLVVPKIFDSSTDSIYPDLSEVSQQINLNIEVNSTGTLEFSRFSSNNTVSITINGFNGSLSVNPVIISGGNANFTQQISQIYDQYVEYLTVDENGIRVDPEVSSNYFLLLIRGIEVEVDTYVQFTNSATASIRIYGNFDVTNITQPENLVLSGGSNLSAN